MCNSQEGYVWVLLDGGPSRAFSDSDITMMEDDLNVLKVSLSLHFLTCSYIINFIYGRTFDV